MYILFTSVHNVMNVLILCFLPCVCRGFAMELELSIWFCVREDTDVLTGALCLLFKTCMPNFANFPTVL